MAAWKDTYMDVLALRARLNGHWADQQLTAPDGSDIDAIMREVDRHLLAVETLLRPESGNVTTQGGQ